MPNYKNILAIDPSGNWYEGKGTTGFCFIKTGVRDITFESICASSYNSQNAYWTAHLDIIQKWYKQSGKSFIVVMEDYILYANKAESQINSHMETSKLIGVIQHYCFQKNIPLYTEPAAAVKKRWNNSILEYRGYIKRAGSNGWRTQNGVLVNRHCLDALRHAVHYDTFKNKNK